MPKLPRQTVLDPLDVLPSSLSAAASDLEHISRLTHAAGLLRVSRRLAVLAGWLTRQRVQTVDLAALEADWFAGIDGTAEPWLDAAACRHPNLVAHR